MNISCLSLSSMNFKCPEHWLLLPKCRQETWDRAVGDACKWEVHTMETKMYKESAMRKPTILYTTFTINKKEMICYDQWLLFYIYNHYIIVSYFRTSFSSCKKDDLFKIPLLPSVLANTFKFKVRDYLSELRDQPEQGRGHMVSICGEGTE